MSNHWAHAAGHALQDKNDKHSGWALLIIGFFLAPMLIGIPLMIIGLFKLNK
jgi:hypothetical protein